MPKKIDLEAQRRAISSAAIGVINQAGLEGLRLRDVARAANVTTGAVTHYFDSKDEVLEAALSEIVRRTLQRMAGDERPVVPGDVDRFIRGVRTYLPVDEAGREEWRVWLAFWGRAIGDSRLRGIHEAYYASIVGRLADLLKAFVEGHASPSRRERLLAADAVVAAIDGVGTRSTLEPDAWPAERQLATLRKVLAPMLEKLVERS